MQGSIGLNLSVAAEGTSRCAVPQISATHTESHSDRVRQHAAGGVGSKLLQANLDPLDSLISCATPRDMAGQQFLRFV